MVNLDRRSILEPWPGPWAKWASVYVTRQGWRVTETLGGYEDAMAECALMWCKCRRCYGATVDNPAWFMRMYQMTVISQFTDLSNKNTHQIMAKDVAAVVMLDHHNLHEAELSLRLRGVSSELQQVLDVLFNAPKEILDEIINPSWPMKRIFRAIADHCGIQKSNALMVELRAVLIR